MSSNSVPLNDDSAPPASPTEQPHTSAPWSLSRRLVFRFLSIYFVLLFLPWPITGILPVVGSTIDEFFARSLWLPTIQVVAKHILRLSSEITHEKTGSGDKLFDYVQMFICICVAIIGTAIWSYVQRKKTNHEKLEVAFRIWLRYTLALVMISYGAYKVIPLQFPTPSTMQLVKTYGESSPMNLLWTFMGFSVPYGVFAGLMELIPSILLLFRRTALLGALMLIGVLSNVVMLNFCFDVPVKLYSSHLLVMGVLIVLPDVQRLWDFFVKNTATAAEPLRKPFENIWSKPKRITAKIVFLVMALGIQFQDVWQSAQERGPFAKQVPYFGAYEVVTFSRNGADVPPLLNDNTRPKYLIVRGFQDKVGTSFKMLGGQSKHYLTEVNQEQKTLALGTKEDEKPTAFLLHFTDSEGAFKTLEGTLEGANIKVELRKVQAEEFALMKRGFHWVSEFPFNR